MFDTLTLLTIALTLPLACLSSSVGEWTLHRYMMHRPVGRFRYPFEAHALVHHKLFGWDDTYHLNGRDAIKDKIPMAWWNGVAIIAIGGIPFYLAACTVGMLTSAWYGWTVGLTFGAVFLANYATYEYVHWCMHLPKARRMEYSWVFRRLNGHHVLHHRYTGHNFNMVLPLADLLFGTLLVRSKKPFGQVRGYSVPDVQPLPA
jgi:hypothetical protein